MSTMDIGLDFVLNFNIISSMMLYMFIVIYFIYVYYHVIRLSLYPIIVCCKLLYFWKMKFRNKPNWTELNGTNFRSFGSVIKDRSISS